MTQTSNLVISALEIEKGRRERRKGGREEEKTREGGQEGEQSW